MAACISEKRESFIGQGRDEQILAPIIIVITEVGAHRRQRNSIAVICDSGLERHLLKRAVPAIVKKKILYGVVGYEDIRLPVFIEIAKGNAHSFSAMTGHPGLP